MLTPGTRLAAAAALERNHVTGAVSACRELRELLGLGPHLDPNPPNRAQGLTGAHEVFCALICACSVDLVSKSQCYQAFLVFEALIDEQGLA